MLAPLHFAPQPIEIVVKLLCAARTSMLKNHTLHLTKVVTVSTPIQHRSAKPGLVTSVALWSARHPWNSIVAWFLFIALTFSVSLFINTRQATSAELTTGESSRAIEMLADAKYEDPAVENIVIRNDSGGDIDLQRVQPLVDASLKQLESTSGVKEVRGPLPSTNGEALLVQAVISGNPDTADERMEPIEKTVEDLATQHAGYQISHVGYPSIAKEFQEWLNADLEKAGLLSLPLTLVILLVVFGAVVMALIPVVVGMAAVISAMGLWAAASQLVPDQGMVSHLILLVGLAVGVDYSLFYLRRFREERHRGVDKIDAIQISAHTAGHSVMVSGTAVTLSMAGLLLVQDAFFSGMAVGAILVVLVAMLSSVTVLPALMSLLGRWMDRPRVPFFWRLTNSNRPSKFMPALVRPVIRHPWISLGLATAFLAVLAAPVMGMSLKNTQVDDYPRSLVSMQKYDQMIKDYPDNSNTNQIVAHVADSRDTASLRSDLEKATQLIAEKPNLYGETAKPWISEDGQTMMLAVSVPHKLDSAEGRESVTDLRNRVIPGAFGDSQGVETAVGGNIAVNIDYTNNLNEKMPIVIGIVIALTFVFMFAVYRSLVVALGTVFLNLISTLASFGILTLIFQNTGAESLLGFESNGHIVSWVPILLFVVLSGLSLDYHVFVVSRIQENARSGMTMERSVLDGVVKTAGVVTSAALIMVAVFSVFGTLSFIEMKQIGVGLAVAILLDATVIRIVALPAILVAFRRFVWWPGKLQKKIDNSLPLTREQGGLELEEELDQLNRDSRSRNDDLISVGDGRQR